MRSALIIFAIITTSYSLTCDEVLELPDAVKLPLVKIQTIPPHEVVKCVANLAKYKLPAAAADYIWQSIKTHFKDVQFIPPEVLMLLHWVTPAITPEEYSNMTLGDVDVIQNFGLSYKLSDAQLSAIADRVRTDFAGKTPEKYTSFDLMALKNILCAFNRSEIERIHPVAYMEAALTIGKLKRCNEDVMTGFAVLAIHPDAFGSPKYWDEDVTKFLGRVLRYVPKAIIYKKAVVAATDKQNKTNATKH